MAVYITIAVGITLLIGIGWFIKSYLDGKTVFNNNSIQQYAYDLHQTKALSTINIHLPQRLEILDEEDDDQEQDEEEIDETVELENEENLYEGTEQVDSSNNNSYYYRDNNNSSSSYNSRSNRSNSSSSSSSTVRDDVYGG
ncbi:hypothetical protein [Gracilibacillus saliphilus]|uniref:hypothetical protein n=1 Tax=Gracilibacillus saliphilus TaxID=543890 RepID=UPI0013D24DB9|nr:hypothetical protein [Gracilibacillus saliphilus]